MSAGIIFPLIVISQWVLNLQRMETEYKRKYIPWKEVNQFRTSCQSNGIKMQVTELKITKMNCDGFPVYN